MGMPEKSWRTARHPSGAKGLQPFRFDIQSEDQRPRAGRIVNIGMRLPPVDKDGDGIGQRMNAVANDELGISALHLEEAMTMRVRMADDREDQAENRDVQQADIHGVDRWNLPLNHKADAVIGATISERLRSG